MAEERKARRGNNINLVVLQGRLTKAPEVQQTQNGKSYCRFAIACNSKHKETPNFIDLTAWNQTAEFMGRYLKKGTKVTVEGHLDVSSYTDKDGNKRYSTCVIVDGLSSERNNDDTSKAATSSQPAPSYASANNEEFEEIVDDDDDLPF